MKKFKDVNNEKLKSIIFSILMLKIIVFNFYLFLLIKIYSLNILIFPQEKLK